jgi:nicotinate phosphoribosyltransferase
VEAVLGAERARGFGNLSITASNDINEEVLHSLNQHGHSITSFGIGTHLVTCLRQPALGCVYKLVEIDGTPRIKLSEDVQKITIPGRKEAYRLYLKNGEPVVDVMLQVEERPPKQGERILCRHPFISSKRAYVQPAFVERLHKLVWDGSARGVCMNADLGLMASRLRCILTIKSLVGTRSHVSLSALFNSHVLAVRILFSHSSFRADRVDHKY